MSEKNLRKSSSRIATFSRFERLHPFKTFLFFGLLGSTLVFLSMVFLYSIRVSAHSFTRHFEFPKEFIVSTIMLLLSSFSISKSVQAFKDDSTKTLQLSLIVTIFLAMLFSALQILGWSQLYRDGLFMHSKAGVTFLYVISAFHLLHIAAGFVGLLYLNYKVYSISDDMVKSLLYFSDKREKTKIELMAIFWHYIDFLWLCLFFMFLFTL